MPHKEPYEAYQNSELDKNQKTVVTNLNRTSQLRILNNDIREFSTVILTFRR